MAVVAGLVGVGTFFYLLVHGRLGVALLAAFGAAVQVAFLVGIALVIRLLLVLELRTLDLAGGVTHIRDAVERKR